MGKGSTGEEARLFQCHLCASAPTYRVRADAILPNGDDGRKWVAVLVAEGVRGVVRARRVAAVVPVDRRKIQVAFFAPRAGGAKAHPRTPSPERGGCGFDVIIRERTGLFIIGARVV